MMQIQCHLVFLCLTLTTAAGLRLYVQPTNFYEYDTDVKLICSDISHSTDLITNVSKITIEIQKDDGTWTPVADIHQSTGNTEHIFNTEITVTGFAGESDKSELTLTWTVASPDMFGRYRCEAVGYTSGEETVNESSQPLDVRGIPEDSSQIYEFIARSNRKVLRYVEEVLSQKLEKQVGAATKQLNSDRIYSFSKLLLDLDARFNELKSRNLSEILGQTSSEPHQSWPQGSFTLLMPLSLCPLDPPDWETGYVKQDGTTDTGRPTIPGAYMALPSYEDGHLIQQFCSLKNSNARQQPWPAGAYCLNQNGQSCPNGFSDSSFQFDTRDSITNHFYGVVPSGTYSTDDTYINYCCRHDGNASEPITLPWSKPFYLYRHGGTCQEVSNMEVVEDFYIFQGMGTGSWGGSIMAYRPDFTLNYKKTTAALCYYFSSLDRRSNY